LLAGGGRPLCAGGPSGAVRRFGARAPRLTDADLAKWPRDISGFLQTDAKDCYHIVERETGADRIADYLPTTEFFLDFDVALEVIGQYLKNRVANKIAVMFRGVCEAGGTKGWAVAILQMAAVRQMIHIRLTVQK
jgi:hypothetical protein